MKAVVYKGKGKVTVEEVPDPKIEIQTDAIVKVTTTAICGSDLHMYEGRTSAKEGMVFGHEIMGVIEEAGKDVFLFSKGDRVSVPFNVACGLCYNCARGFPNACLVMNPKMAGAAYGYAEMGPFRGGQAEFVRVPMADYNCLKLPGEPFDDFEDDFAMLSDIFPTGYHATELAQVQPGYSVAIFGAGPVGWMSAYSAIIKGASQVFVVDQSKERLKKVEEIGAIGINYMDGDPVEQILEHRKDPLIMSSIRPGEEKMAGVLSGIDAVGYQSWKTSAKPGEEDPTSVVNSLARIVDPTGAIGLIGVYTAADPGAASQEAKAGIYPVPLGAIWGKGITIGMGQAPVKKYNAFLRDLIMAGKARPSQVISHKLPLEDAPQAYEMFGKRGTGEGAGWTKVVLKPQMKGEARRKAA